MRMLGRVQERTLGRTLGDLAASSREPTLAGVVLSLMNTTRTNDLAADGFNWAQAQNVIIDPSNHYIVYNQRYNSNSKNNGFSYLNSLSGSWADAALAQAGIERGAPAYDPVNDVVFVLLVGLANTDGIFLRRFTVSRDGSGNVTGLAYDSTVNLVMDADLGSTTMYYQHPALLWLGDAAYGQYGALVAVWNARHAGNGYNELRMSMCVLGSNPTAPGTAANWRAPLRASGTDTNAGLANAPVVAYSALRSTNGGSFPVAPHASISRLADKSLFVAYADGGSTATGKICYKRLAWAALTNDWQGGLGNEQLVSLVQRAGGDAGYGLKYQVVSNVYQDPVTGNVYFGFASWKNNTDGDTWSVAIVTPADVVTIVDVYSAGGLHSWAPTGDCYYDAVAKRLVVTYIQSGASQLPYAQLYTSAGTAKGSPLQLSASLSVDIPYVIGRVGNKLLFLVKSLAGTNSHAGYFGSGTWS